MDCFRTYFTHVQTCDVTRVQSATEWTASVHTLHMSKPNVTRVQSATERTGDGALEMVVPPFETMAMFGIYVEFLPCRLLLPVLGGWVLPFSRFRVPPAASPRPGHRFRVHRLRLSL